MEMRCKKIPRAFVKLLVKGNTVESLGIDTQLRRILLQRRRTRGEKGKMRGAENKVELRFLGKCIDEGRHSFRQHAIAAKLRSPKLNRGFHIRQVARIWKLVERIRQHKGFDPRVMGQWLRGDILVTQLLANGQCRIGTRHIGVEEIRIATGQYKACVATP